MTYHMKRISSLRPSESATSGDREGRVTFPHKLHEALTDDAGLLKWHTDGKSFLVNEGVFEKQVMRVYPGLVQIPTFANFRRQLRWYSFDWTCLNDIGDFEFSHPNFISGRVDLIDSVLTRRKSSRYSKKIRPQCYDEDEYCTDADTPKRVPGSAMTLRARLCQPVQVAETKRRYYKKRAAKLLFAVDGSPPPSPCSSPSGLSAQASPGELWWYYCAIFGEPAHTLPAPEPTPAADTSLEKEHSEDVAIPVYFHDDPVPGEIYRSAECDVGLFGMRGHAEARSVHVTTTVWDLSDQPTYLKL